MNIEKKKKFAASLLPYNLHTFCIQLPESLIWNFFVIYWEFNLEKIWESTANKSEAQYCRVMSGSFYFIMLCFWILDALNERLQLNNEWTKAMS